MPKQGQSINRRANTAAERAAKKQRIVELRSEAKTWREIALEVDVSRRTIQDWRQKDEKFALEVSAAEKDGCDVLVAQLRRAALGEVTLTQQQLLAGFFLVKQMDPSFRENYKFEHVASEGLTAALKKLAKAGRAD